MTELYYFDEDLEAFIAEALASGKWTDRHTIISSALNSFKHEFYRHRAAENTNNWDIDKILSEFTIDWCDIYRDGGSYGIGITSYGKTYEIFFPLGDRDINPDSTPYLMTRLYEDSVNSKNYAYVSWEKISEIFGGKNNIKIPVNRRAEISKIIETRGKDGGINDHNPS